MIILLVDCRHSGTISLLGLHLNYIWVVFESHLDYRRNGAIGLLVRL